MASGDVPDCNMIGREPWISSETCLLQSLNEALKICFFLVGQNFSAMFQRVARIDPQRFLPHGCCFLGPTEVAVARCQENSGNIGVGLANKTPSEEFNSLCIPAQVEIGLGEDVQMDVMIMGIKGAIRARPTLPLRPIFRNR